VLLYSLLYILNVLIYYCNYIIYNILQQYKTSTVYKTMNKMTIIINYQQLFLNYMHAHRYMCTHTHTYDIKTYAHWVTHKYNIYERHTSIIYVIQFYSPHSLVHTHSLLFPSMARINPETTKTLEKHQCTLFTGGMACTQFTGVMPQWNVYIVAGGQQNSCWQFL